MSKLTDLAKELAGLKERKADLEAQLKEVNKQIAVVSIKRLPEAMEDAEQEKFVVDAVGTIYIQDRLEVSVKADDRPRFYEWLRQNGHQDLVVDYVWPRTLSAWAKEQLNEGAPLPDFLKATFIPTAMLRRKS